MSFRSLDHRVEEPLATQLKTVAAALLALRIERRSSRVYINEISDAISQGLLLAATELSMTLLEMWIRDLLVESRCTKLQPRNRHENEVLVAKIDRELEGLDRGPGFSAMCKELSKLGDISNGEEAWLLNVYQTVRNPLHHGISGRFLDPDGEHLEKLKSHIDPTTREGALLYSVFAHAPHRRADHFEDFVYDNALPLLTGIVNFLAAHPLTQAGYRP